MISMVCTGLYTLEGSKKSRGLLEGLYALKGSYILKGLYTLESFVHSKRLYVLKKAYYALEARMYSQRFSYSRKSRKFLSILAVDEDNFVYPQ